MIDDLINKSSIFEKDDTVAKLYLSKAENEEDLSEKLQILNFALVCSKGIAVLSQILLIRIEIYAELNLFEHCTENFNWLQKIDPDWQRFEIEELFYGENKERKRKKIYLKGNQYDNLAGYSKDIAISKENKLVATKHIRAGKLIAIEDVSYFRILFYMSMIN